MEQEPSMRSSFKSRDIFLKDLGKNIRKLRRSKDITQDELARLVGVTNGSYISRIEKGEKEIGSYLLYKIKTIIKNKEGM